MKGNGFQRRYPICCLWLTAGDWPGGDVRRTMALTFRWTLPMLYPMPYLGANPLMLNFLSLTWHTTVLGYPKRRGALAVMTGGCVAGTRKEKTRLSGPVGCWLPFILCNSRDAISIFKLHPLRGGLPLSVSFVVFISFQFALELVKILQKRRAVLCLFLMTVMYILKVVMSWGGAHFQSQNLISSKALSIVVTGKKPNLKPQPQTPNPSSNPKPQTPTSTSSPSF